MYKILIIEDEADILENLKEIFELAGNKVLTAMNGLEGLEAISKIKPDLIICDIMMPLMDGYQVKLNLSRNKDTASIPFIFLTAKADIKSIREGLDLGSDDYIVKPIRARELVDVVYKRMLRIKELKQKKDPTTFEKKLSPEEKIPLNTGRDHIFTTPNDIVLISAKEDYTLVYLNGNQKVLIKKTMKSWETILPEKIFLRVHRNMILNINYVEKVEPWFKGTLAAKVKNYPETINFSKRFSDKFKKMLKDK